MRVTANLAVLCPVLVAAHLSGWSQAQEPAVAAPRVGLWDRFEGEVEHAPAGTDPLAAGPRLEVRYTSPDGRTISFPGFDDGGGIWRFRFMPDAPGTWRYEARFSDGANTMAGRFECVPSETPGLIGRLPSNPIWLGYPDGERVLIRALHVGDRFFASRDHAVTGEAWSPARRAAFLDWAQEQGYNTLSIASFLLNRDSQGRGRGWDTPDLWDDINGRPNPAEYDRLEAVLDDLCQRGMLVYPFAGFCGRDSDFPRDPERRERYLQYTVARLAPYWNLLFSVAGPEPQLKGKIFLSAEEIQHTGRRIAALDPFGHLLSVHNPTGDDPFRDAEWLTYGTLQGPKTRDRGTLEKGLRRNHHPGKPLLAQETLWSGNTFHIRQNKGDYSDADLRKNAWVILMSGAMFVFADHDGDSSSGFSGSMDPSLCRRARHAIVQRVWDAFETLPFERTTPRPDLITSVRGAHATCLADPGRDYLFYLDGPSLLSARLQGGPFDAVWINGRDPGDRREVGPVAVLDDLPTPSGGDDWLLWLHARD